MMQNDNEMTTRPNNPYVGPRAFEYEDRHFYFGRQQEAFEVLALLMARRFLLLYAQSGDGKTSLINAMLRPQLENVDRETGEGAVQDEFEVLPIGRVGDAIKPDGDVDNRFAFNLMVSLAGRTDPEPFTHLCLSDFLLDSVLVEDRLVYAREQVVLEEAGRAQEPAGEFDELTLKPRVLIIDQFEELFTFHPELEKDRANFLEQLTEALEKDPYLYVLLSIRADYLANTFPYARLMPDSNRNRYYMERMEKQGVLEAICEPPKKANPPRTYDDDVAQILVQYLSQSGSANGENASGTERSEADIELVQLQVVCYQLWESLDNSKGGPITMAEVNKAIEDMLKARGQEPGEGDPMAAFIDTALADYYEQAIARVAKESKEEVTEFHLREFFSSKLITAGGVRNLVARESESAGIPLSAIDMLQNDYHLIRNDMRGGREFIELVHDSFIEPIREAERRWYEKRLRDIPWLADARNFKENPQGTLLLDGEMLRKAEKLNPNDLPPEALDYLRASQDKMKDRQRRNRTFAVIALAAVVIVLVYFIFRYRTLNQDLEALRLAEAATDYLLDNNPEPAILLSYHAAKEIKSTQRIQLILFDAIHDKLDSLAGLESDAEKQLRGEYLAPGIEGKTGIEEIANIIAGPKPGSLATIRGNSIYWWNPAAGTEPAEFRLSRNGQAASVDHAVFSPVQKLLATSHGSELLLWQFDNFTDPESLTSGEGKNDISALAFSEDGEHLAVLRGCPNAEAEEAIGKEQQESEQGGCGTQTIEIYETNAANRRDPPEGARFEFEFEIEYPMVDVAFDIDDEGNRFIWSSSSPAYIGIYESKTGDLEKLESLGDLDEIKAMALALDVADDDDLLVIAGCEKIKKSSGQEEGESLVVQEEESSDKLEKVTCGPGNSGFLLWRLLSKKSMTGLSVRTDTENALSDIVYIDNSDQLITLDEEGNLEHWSINIEDYLAAACSIAGRNLNATEWKETFPNIDIDEYENFCDEPLGTHLSVIEELVRACEQESLDSAKEKWEKADRTSEATKNDSFENWAAGVLATKVLKQQVRDKSCYEVFDELVAAQPDSTGLFDLVELKREAQMKLDEENYRGAYSNVAEIAAIAENYPSSVQNAVRDQVSAIYIDLCLSPVLNPEERAKACSGILMLKGDEVVTKTGAPRSVWRISGKEDEYVSFRVRAEKGSDALLTFYDNQLNGLDTYHFSGGDLRIERFFPEEGDYYFEVSYLGDVPEYTLSVVTAVPEEIILGENIDATSEQIMWKISGEKGDSLKLAAHTSTEGDANLTLFDSELNPLVFDEDIDDQILEIEWPVREDSDFYLLISWKGDPQPYSLYADVTMPEQVQFGESVESGSNQAIWQFSGQESNLITIAAEAKAGGDAMLILYDGQYKELAFNDDSDDLDPLIEVVIPEDGVYFVEVGWNEDPQPYTLFVSKNNPDLFPGAPAK